MEHVRTNEDKLISLIKNTAIVIGFWIVGMAIAMVIVASINLSSAIADSVIRDIALAVWALAIGYYFKKPYLYLGTAFLTYLALMQIFTK